jgi:hypothetical protein
LENGSAEATESHRQPARDDMFSALRLLPAIHLIGVIASVVATVTRGAQRNSMVTVDLLVTPSRFQSAMFAGGALPMWLAGLLP